MLDSNPQEEIHGTRMKTTAQETIKDNINFICNLFIFLSDFKHKITIVMLYNAYNILTHCLPKNDIIKGEKENKTILEQMFSTLLKLH